MNYDPLFDDDKNTIDRENENIEFEEPDPPELDTYVSQACRPLIPSNPLLPANENEYM